MNGNILIEASAGTGKTQALAERLIALAKGGVEPYEIVALTFSRAAAGEIFERFVSLLAKKAESDKESAALLRKVVATQHLSQIGTLDSFLTRVVRMFPLELGLDGRAEIMDEFRAGAELSRISFGVLRRTDAKTRRAFADAFAAAMSGEDVRSFVESYRDFIRKWHKVFLDHPAESAWGDASAIWGDDSGWTDTTEEDSVICFTYKIEVNKKDEEGLPLTGAQFMLEKKILDGVPVTISGDRFKVSEDGTTGWFNVNFY